MRRRNDGAGVSPQEEFGDVCFHALGIIDQNREYLQMHLLASADLPTRQALSDIQIESARLDRTVRNAITLYQLENEELSELQPLDLCGLLEKAGFSALRHKLHWHSLMALPSLLAGMLLFAALERRRAH